MVKEKTIKEVYLSRLELVVGQCHNMYNFIFSISVYFYFLGHMTFLITRHHMI